MKRNVWLIIIIALTIGVMMNAFELQKQIEISLPLGKYILGDSMPLKVVYTNITDSTIRFDQPEKSRSIYVNIMDNNKNAQQVRLGKVIAKQIDEETVRYVAEKAETIELLPKGTYEFECDLSARFATLLPPGVYTFQILDNTDEKKPILSNSVQATIVFTLESIPRLMNIVNDELDEDFRRRWATDWLTKLKADFRPQFSVPDDPDSIKEGCRTATKVELDKFRTWWATAQHMDKTKAVVSSINESFFKPEEEKNENENE